MDGGKRALEPRRQQDKFALRRKRTLVFLRRSRNRRPREELLHPARREWRAPTRADARCRIYRTVHRPRKRTESIYGGAHRAPLRKDNGNPAKPESALYPTITVIARIYRTVHRPRKRTESIYGGAHRAPLRKDNGNPAKPESALYPTITVIATMNAMVTNANPTTNAHAAGRAKFIVQPTPKRSHSHKLGSSGL